MHIYIYECTVYIYIYTLRELNQQLNDNERKEIISAFQMNDE